MKIAKISQNYNNQNTSFKGEAERRIFQRAIKTAELKNLLKQPVNDETKAKVTGYFQKKFNQLQKAYSQKHTIVNIKTKINNNLAFKFQQNKERISIVLVKRDESLGISYMERTPISKNTYKNESLNYIYNPKSDNITHSFLKDTAVHVFRLPKKNSKTTDYITHASQIIDNNTSPDKFTYNAIFQHEMDLNFFKRNSIPRKKK